MSAEPSMEEILSSIKRIIAEEGEGPVRGRRAPRPAPPLEDGPEDDEVLELSNPLGDLPDDMLDELPADPIPIAPPPRVRAAVTPPAPAPVVAEPVTPPPVTREPTPAPMEPLPRMADPAPESILSPRTAEASRSSLDTLSRLLVKPEPGSDGTLESMVREMLRPMLREWLDTNLPAMVETMVAAEIGRITGQGR